MPSEKLNGVELYYEIHGRGEPLLLVAGLGSDSRSWGPFLKYLARRRMVIAFDNPGVGRTVAPDAGIGIRHIADDAAALAERLGFPFLDLFGHSMGALAALDLARRRPDRVKKLVLAGIAAPVSERNRALFSHWASCRESGMAPELWFENVYFWIFSARFFANGQAVREAVARAVESPYLPAASAFRKQVEAIAGYDCSGCLSGIAAKTLVLGGQEDLLFPPEACARLAREIPGAAFSLLETAGHALHLEQPRAAAERVLEFLSDG